ncbi:MAG: SpoIIE family protein phosphatase [Anaerolineales bacterium]|nr:SpoIIE family protein phosphatase [Anaerolineales bacterium]
MELQVAVAKIEKYATSESGDTVEVVERPNGGISIVMADGQSSGRGAKWISTLVVRKVIALLADGVRDGAAARAASDSLFTERKGKVSATLNIFSVDKQSGTLVITRNNPAAVLLSLDEKIKILDDPCLPVGVYRGTRPLISEVSIDTSLTAVMFTDGLVHAGTRYGESMDIITCLQASLEGENPSPQIIADDLLGYALSLDQGRPTDDITVVALRVMKLDGDNVRRMFVRLPID